MVLPMRSRKKEKSPYITLEEACKLLEISIATGRNWLKLEKIKYSDPDKGLFERKVAKLYQQAQGAQEQPADGDTEFHQGN